MRIKEKFPKEIITYCFNKNSSIFIYSISNLQGLSFIEIKSKYILIHLSHFYLYNFFLLFKKYNSFLINLLFGLYKNYHVFLKFKGVGYKIIKLGLNYLIKMGLSHRVLYLLKKNSRFHYYNKQSLKIESRSLSVIKNIVFILKKIRKFNCYKKKGVFIKGSIILIKINKKKSKV